MSQLTLVVVDPFDVNVPNYPNAVLMAIEIVDALTRTSTDSSVSAEA